MRFLISRFVLTAAFLAPLGASSQAPGKAVEILTNQTIVQMVLGKLPNEVILSKLQSSKTDFDISVQGLISLHTNKVPTDIIKSMLSTAPKKGSSEVLTNESVISMVTNKLPKELILQKIQSTKTEFDISSSGLVSLNTNKVPKDVLKVMLAGG